MLLGGVDVIIMATTTSLTTGMFEHLRFVATEFCCGATI